MYQVKAERNKAVKPTTVKVGARQHWTATHKKLQRMGVMGDCDEDALPLVGTP